MKNLILLLIFVPLLSSAQLLTPAALDSVKVFRSMERALQVPEEVFVLDLSKKKLGEVPADIVKFKNLNKLILNKNKLKVLPDFLGELKYMQVLRLSNNKLKKFPSVICSFNHLDHLDLGNNSIDSIPECIESLKVLRILDIWGNEIGDFPDEIRECKELRYVDMRTILLSDNEMERIATLIPWAKIYFNQPCNCE